MREHLMPLRSVPTGPPNQRNSTLFHSVQRKHVLQHGNHSNKVTECSPGYVLLSLVFTFEQEVMSGCEQQQLKKKQEDQPVLIHGLSVERYREIYHSVFSPTALAELATARQADYVAQAQDLKQRLWMKLSRPRLQETVGEDGRVTVTEIFDLT